MAYSPSAIAETSMVLECQWLTSISVELVLRVSWPFNNILLKTETIWVWSLKIYGKGKEFVCFCFQHHFSVMSCTPKIQNLTFYCRRRNCHQLWKTIAKPVLFPLHVLKDLANCGHLRRTCSKRSSKTFSYVRRNFIHWLPISKVIQLHCRVHNKLHFRVFS